MSDTFMGPPHTQIPLRPPRTPRDVEIDVDIAPLIQACWALGLRTEACCQGRRDIKHWRKGHNAPAYISFGPAWDIEPRTARSGGVTAWQDADRYLRAAVDTGVGPVQKWGHWDTHFSLGGAHAVYFNPSFIEPITAELVRMGESRTVEAL